MEHGVDDDRGGRERGRSRGKAPSWVREVNRESWEEAEEVEKKRGYARGSSEREHESWELEDSMAGQKQGYAKQGQLSELEEAALVAEMFQCLSEELGMAALQASKWIVRRHPLTELVMATASEEKRAQMVASWRSAEGKERSQSTEGEAGSAGKDRWVMSTPPAKGPVRKLDTGDDEINVADEELSFEQMIEKAKREDKERMAERARQLMEAVPETVELEDEWTRWQPTDEEAGLRAREALGSLAPGENLSKQKLESMPVRVLGQRIKRTLATIEESVLESRHVWMDAGRTKEVGMNCTMQGVDLVPLGRDGDVDEKVEVVREEVEDQGLELMTCTMGNEALHLHFPPGRSGWSAAPVSLYVKLNDRLKKAHSGELPMAIGRRRVWLNAIPPTHTSSIRLTGVAGISKLIRAGGGDIVDVVRVLTSAIAVLTGAKPAYLWFEEYGPDVLDGRVQWDDAPVRVQFGTENITAKAAGIMKRASAWLSEVPARSIAMMLLKPDVSLTSNDRVRRVVLKRIDPEAHKLIGAMTVVKLHARRVMTAVLARSTGDPFVTTQSAAEATMADFGNHVKRTSSEEDQVFVFDMVRVHLPGQNSWTGSHIWFLLRCSKEDTKEQVTNWVESWRGEVEREARAMGMRDLGTEVEGGGLVSEEYPQLVRDIASESEMMQTQMRRPRGWEREGPGRRRSASASKRRGRSNSNTGDRSSDRRRGTSMDPRAGAADGRPGEGRGSNGGIAKGGSFKSAVTGGTTGNSALGGPGRGRREAAARDSGTPSPSPVRANATPTQMQTPDAGWMRVGARGRVEVETSDWDRRMESARRLRDSVETGMGGEESNIGEGRIETREEMPKRSPRKKNKINLAGMLATKNALWKKVDRAQPSMHYLAAAIPEVHPGAGQLKGTKATEYELECEWAALKETVGKRCVLTTKRVEVVFATTEWRDRISGIVKSEIARDEQELEELRIDAGVKSIEEWVKTKGVIWGPKLKGRKERKTEDVADYCEAAHWTKHGGDTDPDVWWEFMEKIADEELVIKVADLNVSLVPKDKNVYWRVRSMLDGFFKRQAKEESRDGERVNDSLEEEGKEEPRNRDKEMETEVEIVSQEELLAILEVSLISEIESLSDVAIWASEKDLWQAETPPAMQKGRDVRTLGALEGTERTTETAGAIRKVFGRLVKEMGWFTGCSGDGHRVLSKHKQLLDAVMEELGHSPVVSQESEVSQEGLMGFEAYAAVMVPCPHFAPNLEEQDHQFETIRTPADMKEWDIRHVPRPRGLPLGELRKELIKVPVGVIQRRQHEKGILVESTIKKTLTDEDGAVLYHLEKCSKGWNKGSKRTTCEGKVPLSMAKVEESFLVMIRSEGYARTISGKAARRLRVSLMAAKLLVAEDNQLALYGWPARITAVLKGRWEGEEQLCDALVLAWGREALGPRTPPRILHLQEVKLGHPVGREVPSEIATVVDRAVQVEFMELVIEALPVVRGDVRFPSLSQEDGAFCAAAQEVVRPSSDVRENNVSLRDAPRMREALRTVLEWEVAELCGGDNDGDCWMASTELFLTPMRVPKETAISLLYVVGLLQKAPVAISEVQNDNDHYVLSEAMGQWEGADDFREVTDVKHWNEAMRLLSMMRWVEETDVEDCFGLAKAMPTSSTADFIIRTIQRTGELREDTCTMVMALSLRGAPIAAAWQALIRMEALMGFQTVYAAWLRDRLQDLTELAHGRTAEEMLRRRVQADGGNDVMLKSVLNMTHRWVLVWSKEWTTEVMQWQMTTLQQKLTSTQAKGTLTEGLDLALLAHVILTEHGFNKSTQWLVDEMMKVVTAEWLAIITIPHNDTKATLIKMVDGLTTNRQGQSRAPPLTGDGSWGGSPPAPRKGASVTGVRTESERERGAERDAATTSPEAKKRHKDAQH